MEDFSELVHLEARLNRLENTGLIQSPKLQRLYLASNQITSITGLENKPHLSLIHLRSNQIESLDGLNADLKKLTYLNLRYLSFYSSLVKIAFQTFEKLQNCLFYQIFVFWF